MLDNGHLHSNLAVGYTRAKIDDETFSMPSVHWDVLSFRTPSGSSFGLYAAAGKSDEASFSSGGIKADWALARTRFHNGASSLSFGINGGSTKFEEDIDHQYRYYYEYYYGYMGESSASGPSAGAQLVYNYLSDDSFGFQVGVIGSRLFDDSINVDIVSGFGGISLVF